MHGRNKPAEHHPNKARVDKVHSVQLPGFGNKIGHYVYGDIGRGFRQHVGREGHWETVYRISFTVAQLISLQKHPEIQ